MLHDFYSSYKTVCDNFTLDMTEFEQIFGLDQTVYAIWDPLGEGLVDSFEVFCGLIAYSRLAFDDKLDCGLTSPVRNIQLQRL